MPDPSFRFSSDVTAETAATDDTDDTDDGQAHAPGPHEGSPTANESPAFVAPDPDRAGSGADAGGTENSEWIEAAGDTQPDLQTSGRQPPGRRPSGTQRSGGQKSVRRGRKGGRGRPNRG
jgi:hypothetical protein